MIELDTNIIEGTKIRVIGVGGGGCNAIDNMILKGIDGVDLIAANTDMQSLEISQAERKINLGRKLTAGKGAGSNPEVGREAAEESADDIKEALKGSDMIFVTCGMGGGTGTGGAPVIARIAKELGSLVVSIVTKPFNLEGKKKMSFATAGIEELEKHSDALIVIPNQKLFTLFDDEITLREGFSKANEVLYNATRGISSIIISKGLVNVDFADVKTVLKDKGRALMGFGRANGKNRAAEAIQMALNSPLLEDVTIAGSTNALVNINSGNDFKMNEVEDILETISDAAGEEINVIWGVVDTDQPVDELKIIVIATGSNTAKDKDNGSLFGATKTININDTIQLVKKPGPISINDVSRRPNRTFTHQSDTFERNGSNSHIPKGSELKTYSEPSIDRRPDPKTLEQIDSSLSKLEKGPTPKITVYSADNKKIVDEPSLYRRRILD